MTEQSINLTEAQTVILSGSLSGFTSRAPSIFVIRNRRSGTNVVKSQIMSSLEGALLSDLKYNGFHFQFISNAFIIIMKQYNKKTTAKYGWKEKNIRMNLLFHLMQLQLELPQLLTQVKTYLLYTQSYGRFLPQSCVHHFAFHTGK